MSMDQTRTLENLTYTLRDALEFTLYQDAMFAEYGEGEPEVNYEDVSGHLLQALTAIVGHEVAISEYDFFVRKANRRVHGD